MFSALFFSYEVNDSIAFSFFSESSLMMDIIFLFLGQICFDLVSKFDHLSINISLSCICFSLNVSAGFFSLTVRAI